MSGSNQAIFFPVQAASGGDYGNSLDMHFSGGLIFVFIASFKLERERIVFGPKQWLFLFALFSC